MAEEGGRDCGERAHEVGVRLSAGRPLRDARPSDRDGDENDGVEPLLLHEFGPDQGPHVSFVAAGAKQWIDRFVAVATKIIEHLAAADKALADLICGLRLAE